MTLFTITGYQSVSDGLLLLGVLLDLGGRLFVFLADFVELFHVVEELCTALESNE